MKYIKTFNDSFINEEYTESISDPKFEIGDEVLVKGTIGSHYFNKKGTIIKKNNNGSIYFARPSLDTGFQIDDDDEDYIYYGTVYYIDTIKYWAPPFAITKIDDGNDKNPRIRWYKNGKFEEKK